MKRFLTALAVALAAIFAFAGCNDYGNTFQNNTGAQITTLSPSNIAAGSAVFTLTVSGSGFVTQTYIAWNGTKLATTDITDTAGDVLQVTAQIPASLVAAPGKATIITHNPFSGAGNNGLSNPINFIITPVVPPNSTPLLTSLSPAGIPTTAVTPQTLTLTGADFVTNSDPTQAAIVCWNTGTTSATQVKLTVSSSTTTQLIATVPANLISAAGTASLIVVNPPNPPGTPASCATSTAPLIGLPSNPLAITLATPNPVPSLASVTPASVTTGAASLTLALTGASFATNSDPSQAASVYWHAGTVSTLLPVASGTTPSATQINVTVPSTLYASAGTATVNVVNPPAIGLPANVAGGGISNFLTITIVAGAQAAVEETPAVSADGRYVAYTSMQGPYTAIFFRDTCEGAAAACQPKTSLLSLASDGAAANNDSHTPSMSADGRYVAFASAATNLLPADAKSIAVPAAGRQIYLRDTCTGAAPDCAPSTQLVSTDSSGALLGTENISPSLSASGRFIAFVSVMRSNAATAASVPRAAAPTNSANSGYRQVFLRDTCLGAAKCTPKISRISMQPGDGTENGPSPTAAPGPALSSNAGHLALTGGSTAVLFTRSVAIDDRVFLAVANAQP